MSRKLQVAIDELSRELKAHLPEVTLDVWPRSRKSAYIYMIPPHKGFWDDDRVLDIVDGMSQKQVDVLLKTGNYILFLQRDPWSVSSAAVSAALREPSPEWSPEKGDGERKGQVEEV